MLMDLQCLDSFGNANKVFFQFREFYDTGEGWAAVSKLSELMDF